MYPEKIKLDKGDTVRWHFDDLVNDFHTVTMPYKKALDISNNGFLPVCDPDGDGDGPDTFDVDFETFTCPPASGDLELDLTRDLTAQSGNGKFGGNGLESSGLKFSELPSAPGLAGGGESWDVKFTEKSNDEGYRYICAVHGKFMSGWVVVK
jgi:plastocyanin